MAKFCSECGAKMEDGELFCGECGTKVDLETAGNVGKISDTPFVSQKAQKPKTEQTPNTKSAYEGNQQKQEMSTGDILLYNAEKKDLALGLILTFLFGGIGLLYASVSGAIIMVIVEFITLLLCAIGIGLLLLPIVHLVCMFWTYNAIKSHNKKLMESMINKNGGQK